MDEIGDATNFGIGDGQPPIPRVRVVQVQHSEAEGGAFT